MSMSNLADVRELAEFFDAEARGWGRTVPARPRSRGHHDADDRAHLAALLTLRPPRPLPQHIARELDAVLAAEAEARQTTDAGSLPRLAEDGPLASVSVWHGDVTRLRVDALVNAANSALLGCFSPAHACVDNAVHAAAGPGLRAECADLVAAQGHPEPVGSAQVTGAYHLPARHVIHTVGPTVAESQATAADAALLRSCYLASLEAARREGDTSVAFPAISAGAYGYPAYEAATVAVAAIIEWLDAHAGDPMHVVLVAFSAESLATYGDVLAAL